MDDETLTPFVDALSASLIVMVLIAISFILQNAIALNDSAQSYVDVSVKDDAYSPIFFRKPVKIDFDKKEILFLVNFELTEIEIENLRNELLQYSSLNFRIESRETDKKSTASLIRFILMMSLPKDIPITTEIKQTKNTLSKLIWSK